MFLISVIAAVCTFTKIPTARVLTLLPASTTYQQPNKLVWLSGNGVCHFNEVMLQWARLVMRLVMTLGGSTIPIFIQANSAWPSLRG